MSEKDKPTELIFELAIERIQHDWALKTKFDIGDIFIATIEYESPSTAKELTPKEIKSLNNSKDKSSLLKKLKKIVDITPEVKSNFKPDFNLVYLRLDQMDYDNNKKGDWWHCSFSALTFPIMKFTWTIRSAQLTGEIFTMGGLQRWMRPVDFKADSILPNVEKVEKEKDPSSESSMQSTQSKSKIVDISSRFKKSSVLDSPSDPSVA